MVGIGPVSTCAVEPLAPPVPTFLSGVVHLVRLYIDAGLRHAILETTEMKHDCRVMQSWRSGDCRRRRELEDS